MTETDSRWRPWGRTVRLLSVLALVLTMSGCCCCVIPISSRDREPDNPDLEVARTERLVHRAVPSGPAVPLER